MWGPWGPRLSSGNTGAGPIFGTKCRRGYKWPWHPCSLSVGTTCPSTERALRLSRLCWEAGPHPVDTGKWEVLVWLHCKLGSGYWCDHSPVPPGVHAAQGECQAEAEADRSGGLTGPAGQRGPLWQLSSRGLRGASPGYPHQPGRHPGCVAAPAQAPGALQLHPPGGRQRHRLLRLHQIWPRCAGGSASGPSASRAGCGAPTALLGCWEGQPGALWPRPGPLGRELRGTHWPQFPRVETPLSSAQDLGDRAGLTY